MNVSKKNEKEKLCNLLNNNDKDDESFAWKLAKAKAWW